MKTRQSIALFLGIVLITLSFGCIQAQTITVTGKVTDALSGSPIPGCSITVRGNNNSTATDNNGKYTIQAKKGFYLIFSSPGYEVVEHPVSGEKMDIRLHAEEFLYTEEVFKIVEQEEQCVMYEAAPMAAMKSMADMNYAPSPRQRGRELYASNEEYHSFTENRFIRALDEALSTFSIDVDAASYSNMRRFVNQGQLPPSDAIRTEELINYFSYDYAKPNGTDPIKISAEAGPCPWNNRHRLVRIGLKAREIADDKLPASNLVFLIDVSGSMYGPTRLELVKSSLKLLINNLREQDRVAIVVYSGSAGEVLPSTSGSDKQKIREALDMLTAGGSTAGGAGIQLAYSIARKNFIKEGNNRIILCTDGDFNVGISSRDGLEGLIEKERKSGVFLTILGYGMGNYKDDRMQVLAEKGNGNHAYIDNLQEANKVLVNEFGGTIFTVAKDVKLQIEFNPEHVQAYRLIGYESRLLNKEDFNDDTKDAGEMGAGHNVTAFYEIVPTGVKSNYSGSVDPLKYQQVTSIRPVLTGSGELMTIKLRYKQPDKDVSRKIEVPVIDNKQEKTSSDFRFASAVAMFGQLLRNSEYKGEGDYDKVIAQAKSALDNDDQGYRREFIRLAETVRGMAK